MQQHKMKKGGRKRKHPNLDGYKDLLELYRKAYPRMSYEDAKEATLNFWKQLKDKYDFGMYL